jgi:glutathione synthase/RimK-type ligase-like ATP-grasp enzyme
VSKATECAIATCSQLPDLDPDDRLLSEALVALGARVSAKVWSDPTVDWSSADVCVVRSTWDYHKQFAAFDRWIDAVSTTTCLLNPAHVIRWNCHKFYLRDLERRGVPVVPTVWMERGERVDLGAVLDRVGWPEAVIKPAYGASADGILRVGPDDSERERGESHLRKLLEAQDVLVQPYLSTISEHLERALVFIDGIFSHAVAKLPFMHANSDLALRSLHPPGASGEFPVEATANEIEVARHALSEAPNGHVYARVDLVRDADSIRVLEVELIEPTLYLFAHVPAARNLARAILARVHDGRDGVNENTRLGGDVAPKKL